MLTTAVEKMGITCKQVSRTTRTKKIRTGNDANPMVKSRMLKNTLNA